MKGLIDLDLSALDSYSRDFSHRSVVWFLAYLEILTTHFVF